MAVWGIRALDSGKIRMPDFKAALLGSTCFSDCLF